MCSIKKYIRQVPDFPKAGITFYDVTTLIRSDEGFKLALDELEKLIRPLNPDLIVGIESRGFVFGAPLADRLDLGLAVARKPGKLPANTVSCEYELEYGKDRLEMHRDAVSKGQGVIVVDDLIATGGTLSAACHLVEKLGGEVAAIVAVVELSFLPWRERLKNYQVHCLASYDSQ